MGINKIAEFYQSLSYLKLFSKRQFNLPKANMEKVRIFSSSQLTCPIQYMGTFPRLKVEKSKYQRLTVTSGMSISWRKTLGTLSSVFNLQKIEVWVGTDQVNKVLALVKDNKMLLHLNNNLYVTSQLKLYWPLYELRLTVL